MKLPRLLNRQHMSLAASISFLLVMLTPILTPAFASAATVSDRSIQMSSSVKSDTNVSYTLTFTPVSNASGFVLDFCDNTAVPGTACTAPPGFSTSGATTTAANSSPTATGTVLANNDGVVVDQALSAGTADSVEISGITNPSYLTDDSTGFYGRIVTYSSAPSGLSLTDNTTLDSGDVVDEGGIPLATTEGVGVSASVAETMTFCVSASLPGVDCATTTTPNIKLGTTEGDQSVLTSGALSTGTVYAQITTNAVHGAVVNMNSDATSCGGLLLVGSSQCNILPASSSTAGGAGVAAGDAYFGVETAGSSTATTSAPDPIGELEPVAPYTDSNYEMDYVAGNTTGVTSPYGSAILDTNGAPANNQNMALTFGASVNDNTAAGDYYADLGLIASGTY